MPAGNSGDGRNVRAPGDKIAYIGRVGEAFSAEEGKSAARLCAIGLLAQLNCALNGDLDRDVGCLRLRGFVNATPTFVEHPSVINGASDLLIDVFGERGRRTRVAIGVASLPHGVAVEVDAEFAVNT